MDPISRARVTGGSTTTATSLEPTGLASIQFSEAILQQHLGEERLSATRALFRTLHPFREPGHDPVETPDLLIYKPDASEIRFAECKRTDTADKLNRRQALGLALIAAALRCPVDLFAVAPVGVALSPQPIEVEFPWLAQ